MIFFRSAVCALVVFAVASGCSSGPKLVTPKGQLTFKQAPLKIDPKASVTVVFLQAVDAGENANSYAADPLNREDASFTVPGRKHTGIPIGKYRVAINVIGTAPRKFPTSMISSARKTRKSYAR